MAVLYLRDTVTLLLGVGGFTHNDATDHWNIIACADLYLHIHRQLIFNQGFPGGSVVKNMACQWRRYRFNSWMGMILWRRKWQPTLVFLPGKSHGQRSLAGYSPWGCQRVRHDLVTKTATSIMTNEKFRNKFFLQEIT